MNPDQLDADGISTIAKELGSISRDNEENRERERAGSHHGGEEENNSGIKSEKDRGAYCNIIDTGSAQ